MVPRSSGRLARGGDDNHNIIIVVILCVHSHRAEGYVLGVRGFSENNNNNNKNATTDADGGMAAVVSDEIGMLKVARAADATVAMEFQSHKNPQ